MKNDAKDLNPLEQIEKALAEMEAREKAATPGPWFFGGWSGQCHKDHMHGLGSCVYDMFKTEGTNLCASDGATLCVTTDEYIALNKAEGEFIAHARTDVPKLIMALRKAIPALRYYDSYIGNDEQGVQARKALRTIAASLTGEGKSE